MRIVATDALVSPEPHDLFAIDKDRQDVIRTQRAAGAFEGEMFDGFAVLEMKGGVSIRGDPNILAGATSDGGHRTRGRIGLGGFERIALIKERTVVGACPHTRPEMSASVRFQRVDEVAARLADHFLRLAVFD